MRRARTIVCIAVASALVVAAGASKKRDVFVMVKVAKSAEPDTVVVAVETKLPPRVHAGSREVTVFDFSLWRATEHGKDTPWLASVKFRFMRSDSSVVDPFDVISLMKVTVAGREFQAQRNGEAGILAVVFPEPLPLSNGDSLRMTCVVDVSLDARATSFGIRVRDEWVSLRQNGTPSPRAALTDGNGFRSHVEAFADVTSPALSGSFVNYPNPFAAGRRPTTFSFYLPKDGQVTLRLYTGFGRLLKVLDPGTHRTGGVTYEDIRWDGRDRNGAVVQNGTYFAVLRVLYTDGTAAEAVRKVAVLR